jgi:cell wall-associated NlpC family hydrolase
MPPHADFFRCCLLLHGLAIALPLHLIAQSPSRPWEWLWTTNPSQAQQLAADAPDGIEPVPPLPPPQPPDGNQTAPSSVSPGKADGKAIAQAAHNHVGLSTRNMAGTNGGRLACAGTVNAILKNSGIPQAGGGLSTAAMYQSLASGRGTLVPLSQTQPGDIIISPTTGGRTGHVGIMGINGRIIENSSSRAMVVEGRSLVAWNNYYSGRKGLPTYAFRL